MSATILGATALPSSSSSSSASSSLPSVPPAAQQDILSREQSLKVEDLKYMLLWVRSTMNFLLYIELLRISSLLTVFVSLCVVYVVLIHELTLTSLIRIHL